MNYPTYSNELFELADDIRKLSDWIDSHPANVARNPEALTWSRLSKIGEESGEVMAAMIGVTGQNPRKGVTHTIGDVAKELLDVAVTALAAYEHVRGNDGSCMAALCAHMTSLMNRAGIE